MSIHPIRPDRGGSKRTAERGFTLLEVIVSIAVLAVIIVPLTSSLMQVLDTTRSTTSRLDQSNDQQRITAAWTRDVQSLDKSGLKQTGPCQGAVTGSSGTDILTFHWDQASVAAGSGQDDLVAKSATWAVMGTGKDMVLTRRYCEGGAAVSETRLAAHIGIDGQGPTATVHGPGGPSSTDFCNANSCTLVITGSFDMKVNVARRVPGVQASDATPPPPTITGVSPSNGYLSVFWTPPAALPAGVSPIVGYRVEAWSTATGGVVKSTEINASSNSADLTGLTNGTDYWVVVYSKNIVGQGEPSEAFGPVKPSPLKPTQPLDVTVTPADLPSASSMVVSWTAPTDNGGATVDGYEVQATRQDGVAAPPVSVSGATLTAVVSGLSPDWTYTFRVRAHNSVDYGPLSDPVTGDTRPPTPVSVSATPGSGRVFVSFTISGNGNVALATTDSVLIKALCVTPSATCTDRSYTMARGGSASLSSDGSFGPLETSAASGALPLVNGEAYRITVELRNSSGNWGLPSEPSDPVTPTGVPLTPTSIVSIASRGVSHNLHFSLSSGLTNGGLPISSYNIKLVSGATVLRTLPVPAGSAGDASFDWDGTKSGESWTAFTDFQDYDFIVEACNANGCSDPSSTLTATPGVGPSGTMGLVRGAGPGQVVASVSAVTDASASTTWSFSCTGAATVAAFGTTPSITVSNVDTGNTTCTGVGNNIVKAVTSGAPGTKALPQTPQMTGTIGVYGKPSTPANGPIMVPKATGTVNTATVIASNSSTVAGPSGSVQYRVVCTPVSGGSAANGAWAASPGLVTVSPGVNYSCVIVARNSVSLYESDPSPATVWRAQRMAPTVVSVRGSRAVPVQQTASNTPAGVFYAQVVITADPGLLVTGMSASLTGTPSGTYGVTGLTRTAVPNGLTTDYYVWAAITPAAGDWPGIGSNAVRATGRTAKLWFQLTGADTVSSASIDYFVVPSWDNASVQDVPAATSAAGSTTGAATTLVPGTDNFTAAFQCTDADSDGGNDDDCATAKIWLRNMMTGDTVQVGGSVVAGDGVAHTYVRQVPAGLATGRWTIEAEFCNEDGACPSSPSSGYDGSDFQTLGFFSVS